MKHRVHRGRKEDTEKMETKVRRNLVLKNWELGLAVVALVVTLGWAQSPQAAPQTPTKQAAPAIAAAKVQEHVNYLANPAMKGRGTGTTELDKAARYIAQEFREDGLEPGAGKSYFQKFTVTVGA